MIKTYFLVFCAFLSLSHMASADIVRVNGIFYVVNLQNGQLTRVNLVHQGEIRVVGSNLVEYKNLFYAVDPSTGTVSKLISPVNYQIEVLP